MRGRWSDLRWADRQQENGDGSVWGGALSFSGHLKYFDNIKSRNEKKRRERYDGGHVHLVVGIAVDCGVGVTLVFPVCDMVCETRIYVGTGKGSSGKFSGKH